MRATFDEFDVQIDGDSMVLRGTSADHSALHGVLRRTSGFGIGIVEVRRDPHRTAEPPNGSPDPSSLAPTKAGK